MPIKRTCARCGKEFLTKPYLVRNGQSNFCSNLCRREPEEKRFWDNVFKTKTCWFWIGATNGSYGLLFRGGTTHTTIKAHRMSWILHHGNIGKEVCVLHKCDTPSCVNPEHL